ncbi:peptide chain release factor N(5)-glutamine methyltransferase [Casimicrobium huifangae]|uniref:peptide chain release factor N(5)-glutamine methyltransferase n=1 Tax=Casimicrobium huifangae TaxID=2591109 RepID=UPI00307F7379
MPTIRDALPDNRLPRLETRMLLAHALGHARPANAHAWLVARDTETLPADATMHFNALIERRIAGEPIAYLIGHREFYGRDFACSPAALIPRPETELLIDLALAELPADFSGHILDVGTGTGCIAITLALERPQAHVTALDVSPDALALARANAAALGAGNVRCVESNWFAELDASAQFDLIVSNPPYIVPGDAHLTQGDLRFEPTVALADAVDGLESYRQLAIGAHRHLAPGGWLMVEHGYDQGESVPSLLRTAAFADVALHCDLAKLPRVTTARYP